MPYSKISVKQYELFFGSVPNPDLAATILVPLVQATLVARPRHLPGISY